MTQRFGGIIPAFVMVCVYITGVVPARADEIPTITQAVVDYTAHTLTASLAHVRAHRGRMLRPRACLRRLPLTVNGATVNAATQTGVLTMTLPDPIPVGSFSLQVAWDDDDDNSGLTFEVTLGAVGPVGAQGPQGPMGATGSQGPSGAQGAKGETGAQGPQGVRGDQGPAGAAGAVGPIGPVGAIGPQGPKGEKGDGFTFRGSWDTTASYHLNDVVTENGSAYVAVAGSVAIDPATDTAPTSWVVLAARGTKGDKGDQGIQGLPGINGLPGAKGEVGPQGAAGSPGAAGSVLVGANNWFLPNGAWSILDNTLTVLPGSGFVAKTTGGPLVINVTLGATFLQALSQFSCLPAIDGAWAGRFGFGPGLQTSLPYVEGIEYNGTANLLLVAWSRSRIYSGIQSGTHNVDIRCWATGGLSAPLVADFAVNSLTVKESR
jgi:hypothetical protein